jgi:hypothetical protein
MNQMDADQVAQAVTESGIHEAYSGARDAMNSVWLQNRKVLYSLVLDGDAASGIGAAEDLPALIDEAIQAFLVLDEKALSLSWDLG